MGNRDLSRREVISGIGGSSTLALFPAIIQAAPFPNLTGVDFYHSDTIAGQKMAMGFNYETIQVPKLRAVCRTPTGVQNAVSWAKETGTSFSIFSTGHCFTDHSQHSQLVIDTSQISALSLDMEHRSVKCGAGTFIGNVYNELASHKLGLAGGTYGSVGVTGLTLGGGIGYLARSHGLLCDQMIAMQMVTASGNLTTVSAEENADLFWACRGGGGGNFGVVTSIEYRAAYLPVRTSFAPFLPYTSADAARLIYDWQFWTEAQGKDLTSHLLVYKRSDNRFVIGLQGDAILSGVETRSRLAELNDSYLEIHENYIPDYYSSNAYSRRNSWDNVIIPAYFSSKSDFIERPLSLKDIQEILNVLNAYRPGEIKLTFEALGGAVSEQDNIATAYPHRDARYLIEYRTSFSNVFERERSAEGLERVRALFSPNATGRIYVNYPVKDLDNWPDAYWGENLARLKKIKRKWDPDNLFRHSQSIPL